MAMTLVSTVTVGAGGAASIEFTGIPQTGKDLLLIVSARATTGGVVDAGTLRFNSDSGATNYVDRQIRGLGSSVDSSSQTASYIGQILNGNTSTANTFSSQSIYVSNYTSATTKSISRDFVLENNATDSRQMIHASSWSGTTAITSIQLADVTYAQHSTASLYIIS